MALLDFMPLFVMEGYSFASDWFHARTGMSFARETMLDPLARADQEFAGAQYVHERYPELFPNEPARHARLGIGVATVPRLWGCKIKYQPHMNPTALPLLGSTDDPRNLHLPEATLDENLQWLLEEVDVLVEHGYSRANIRLPDLQGPLNVATKLLGDTRMLRLVAMRKKASVVHQILAETARVYIRVTQALRAAMGRPARANFSISGCTHAYLGPRHWRTFILPVVRRLEVLGDRIRLHHCGAADAAKVETYATYPFHEVEFGFGSDLRAVRQHFLHPVVGPVLISCRVSPYRMLNQTPEQIYRDVEGILETARGGPVKVSVVGVPRDAPDANLQAIHQAVTDYNHEKEQELEAGA